MLHKSDKRPVNRFRTVATITFILELTLLMSIQLILVHGQGKAINQKPDISLSHLLSTQADRTATGLFKSPLIDSQELIPSVHVTEQVKLAVQQFKTVPFRRLVF